MSVLASGFVYLRESCPSIIEDIRYFTDNNFVGTVVDGYHANCAIVTERAATCLKLAQDDFVQLGFSLVIYEAYRPQKATDHFVRWAKDGTEHGMQRLYYPRIDKSTLFDAGYISSRSAHTRGAAVDVSLIPLGKSLRPCAEVKRRLQDGTEFIYLDDGTVNMGGHFDLLDEISWHDSNLVTEKQTEMRNLLRSVMEKRGFKMYRKEWWHYSLADEPFPNTYFDFDVQNP